MLKRLYIHNYKCLVNFEWKPQASRTALLLGRNGAGKSSAADVLLFLRDIGRGETDTGKIGVSDGLPFSPLMVWNGRKTSDEPMVFEIDVDLGGVLFSYRLALDLPETFSRFRVASESLCRNGEVVFRRDSATVMVRNRNGVEVELSHDGHSVFLPTFQHACEAGADVGFKEWLGRMLVLAPIPALMTGELIGDGFSLARDAHNIADWVITLQNRDSELAIQVNNRMRDIFPDFKSFGARKLTPGAKYGKDFLFLKFQNNKTSEIPFFLLSDGMKCFFLSALLPAAVNLEPSLFCFWDEPDAYLALSEVENFISTLRQQFSKHGQCVVSTHHPETMNGFPEDESWLLARHDNLSPTRPPQTLRQYRQDKAFDGDFLNAWLMGDVGNE